MSVARFHIHAVPRGAVLGSASRVQALTWRLVAANNRAVGRAAGTFADVATCIAVIDRVRHDIGAAPAITSRTRHGQWTWRIRFDGVDLAIASRSYPRRVQADGAYDLFLALASVAGIAEPGSPAVHEFGTRR